jgi:hypothetical protein
MRTRSIRTNLENVLAHFLECYGITEFRTFLQMNSIFRTLH